MERHKGLLLQVQPLAVQAAEQRLLPPQADVLVQPQADVLVQPQAEQG